MTESTTLEKTNQLPKTNSYSMKETMEVAQRGMVDIENFLTSYKSSLGVINVEDHKDYQKKDIDLLWVFQRNGKHETKSIELKVDRYKSRNFFFETISNQKKGTPGCFMYTEADYLFYYFESMQTLYILPVEEVREWFLQNMSRFEEKTLGTQMNGETIYGSVGRLVPIQAVVKECAHIKCYKIPQKR